MMALTPVHLTTEAVMARPARDRRSARPTRPSSVRRGKLRSVRTGSSVNVADKSVLSAVGYHLREG